MSTLSKTRFTPASCLPSDYQEATLIGRAWLPQVGPAVVLLRSDAEVVDLTTLAPTVSALLELADPIATIRHRMAGLPRICQVAELLANSAEWERDLAVPWLLAPCDLQAVKACGVTFVSSMLERVIEEQARGDPSKAQTIRESMVELIGEDFSQIVPGSSQAADLKALLVARGVWSQYLEVGIGPDAEIFSKSQPMSPVGFGADIGLHPKSQWNNPEPEVVLAVDSRGRVAGATLGNDVNLRDFEGRSALLLGKAKDNNGSCAIGPFIRLFDDRFGIEDVRHCELSLRIEGPDGFNLQGSSNLSQISRDPLDLVSQTLSPNHQYPDGLMLFLGTMFAPTQDRFAAGQGFSHVLGDITTIATPLLGSLVNRVSHSDQIAPWTFGTGALMRNLSQRGLL